MNPHSQTPARRRTGPYQRALTRLEERLARRNDHSNAEIIRRLQQVMFPDVDALERAGAVQLPD
jgi:hypothetical protein